MKECPECKGPVRQIASVVEMPDDSHSQGPPFWECTNGHVIVCRTDIATVLSDLVGEESPERRKVLIRIPPELDTLLRYEARLQNLSKNAFMTRLLLEGVKGERPVATTKVTKKKVTKKKVTKASRKPTVHDLEIESRGCRLGLEVAITLLQEKASTLFMQKQDRLAAFARDVAEELIAHRDFSPEDLGADDEGDFSPEGDGGDGWD